MLPVNIFYDNKNMSTLRNSITSFRQIILHCCLFFCLFHEVFQPIFFGSIPGKATLASANWLGLLRHAGRRSARMLQTKCRASVAKYVST